MTTPITAYRQNIYWSSTNIKYIGMYIKVNRILLNIFDGMMLLIIGLYSAIFFSICMIITTWFFSTNIFIIVVPTIGIFFFSGFIVPNSLAKTMSLFPKLAGTASAIFGTLTGIIVSVVTFISTNFQNISQFSLACSYLVMLLLSVIIYYVSNLIEKNVKK